MVLLGSPHGDVTLSFYGDVHARGLRLIGAHIGLSEHTPTPHAPWDKDRNRRAFVDLVARWEVAVGELVTHRVAPDGLPGLYALAAETPGELLAVIVDWEGA